LAKALTLRRLKAFAVKTLRLRKYFLRPGDGRVKPQIPARVLVWTYVACTVLREVSFLAMEALVRSRARRALGGVASPFGDDALAYFTERLDAAQTRDALASILRHAKRGKAFENTRFVGLAIDGTGGGNTTKNACALCHPIFDSKKVRVGYNHHFCMIAVVGAGLSLPFDVEPYGPEDCEYNGSQRLLERAVGKLGKRFADYVVADGLYATAPFLHKAGDLGLRVVARLKDNLPNLFTAAKGRYALMPPTDTFKVDKDHVEIWDKDDFDPWEGLRWTTVRVIRYRQTRPNGTVCEAYWLTDWPTKELKSLALFKIAKNRWEIENQGFNDAKTRYGMEHITHHHVNSLEVGWLLTILAIAIERLYRLRYLHRGSHPLHTPIELLRILRLNLLRTRPGSG